jgi:hypothetical protein
MTRSQIVTLRVGQMVRTKHMPDSFWKIAAVYTPAHGGRVIELSWGRNRVWIGPDEVEEVLAA